MKDKKDKNKRKIKIFKATFIVLFIIFIVLYFSEVSGYYEFKNSKIKDLTQKQVEQFEKDIAHGKEVDIKDYVIPKKKNYQNNISKAGLKVSNTVSNLVQKGLDSTFSVLIKLIEE